MASVREVQAPLRARYKADPSTAVVIDRARSAVYELADPFHAAVVPQGSSESLVVATHRGGSLGVPAVPVGFLRMRTHTRVGVRNGGQPEIDKLMAVSQQCCVVGKTLSAGVIIEHQLAT